MAIIVQGFVVGPDLWPDLAPDLEPLGPIVHDDRAQAPLIEAMADRALALAPVRFRSHRCLMGGYAADPFS